MNESLLPTGLMTASLNWKLFLVVAFRKTSAVTHNLKSEVLCILGMVLGFVWGKILIFPYF